VSDRNLLQSPGRSEVFFTKSGSKQDDVVSPLFFNFVLEYDIKRVQVKQDGLKLNGTRQLLV
jgi:hypothetical protein